MITKNILKYLAACFVYCGLSVAFTSCSSDEDPFFSASEDDYPRIINTDLPEGKGGEPAELPSIVFEGPIRVIFSQQEAENAVDYLLAQPILGIDTETKPSFKKGHTNMVSLLQVSTLEQCFLFRINRLGMPKCIIKFLEDSLHLSVRLVVVSIDEVIVILHYKSFPCEYRMMVMTPINLNFIL